MTDQNQHSSFEPFLENRRSFILLRWLLVILTSYLILSAGDGSAPPPLQAVILVAGFFLSNLAIALLAPGALAVAQSRYVVVVLDAIFISGGLYLLRVEGPQIHLAFTIVFLVALISTNLRLTLFAMLVSSILLGAFSFFGTLGFGTEVPVRDFLSLALFFVVALFYVFLASRFDRDSATASLILSNCTYSF